MSREKSLSHLLDRCLVAVLRTESGDDLIEVATALAAGGIDTIEVTFTVPRALRVIERLADHLGNRILLGAGTVLDCETARAAILAGAQFIVSPVFKPDLITLCRRYGKLVMSGAFTPTEVLSAWEAGADVVKVFPSEVVGPGYLRALAGPLPQIRLMPTGGVTLENAARYLEAGACALGVGSSLVSSAMIAQRNWSLVSQRAADFVKVVCQARANQKI